MKNHHYNYNLLLSLPYTSHQSPNLTKAMKHDQQKISCNTAMYLQDDCPSHQVLEMEHIQDNCSLYLFSQKSILYRTDYQLPKIHFSICQLYALHILSKLSFIVIPKYQYSGITHEFLIQTIYYLF